MTCFSSAGVSVCPWYTALLLRPREGVLAPCAAPCLSSAVTWAPVILVKLSRKVEGALNALSTFSSAPDTYLSIMSQILRGDWLILHSYLWPGSVVTQLMSYPCTWGLATSCHTPPAPAHWACILAVWSLPTVTR